MIENQNTGSSESLHSERTNDQRFGDVLRQSFQDITGIDAQIQAERSGQEPIIETVREIQVETTKLAEIRGMTIQGSEIDREELARAQDSRLDALRRYAGHFGVADTANEHLMKVLTSTERIVMNDLESPKVHDPSGESNTGYYRPT